MKEKTKRKRADLEGRPFERLILELQRPHAQYLQWQTTWLSFVCRQKPVGQTVVILNLVRTAAVPCVVRIAHCGQLIAGSVLCFRDVNGAIEVAVSAAVMYDLSLTNHQHNAVPGKVS